MPQQPKPIDEEVILVLPNGSELVSTRSRAAQDWAIATQQETPKPGVSLGGIAKAAGKGVLAGIGGAPAELIYNQAKDIYNDPVKYISDVGAQLGAIGGGMGVGALTGGPFGAAAGAVGGAVLGGGGGQAIENMIRARPVGEGVAGEAALQGAVQSLPIVGKGLAGAGRWAMGKAVGPPMSILNKMAEARANTPQELRGLLSDVSYEHRIAPTGAGLLKAIGKVDANSAEQKAMEVAAGEAGRSINMRGVMKATQRDALKYKKPGATIPSIEADTRPSAAIAATKAALEETATRNPNLSVPLETNRLKMQDAGSLVDEVIYGAEPTVPFSGSRPSGVSPSNSILPKQITVDLNVPFRTTIKRGESLASAVELPPTKRSSIPNPAAAPSVVGDVRRGVNAKLADAYGSDPETKAAIVVDKSWTRNAGKSLEDVTGGLGERPYAEVGKESHNLLNLIDAIRQRSYNTATNPVRLYEFLGALSGNPSAIGLGLASRPPVMWTVGKGARQMGEHVGAINPALIRAALAAKLGQDE